MKNKILKLGIIFAGGVGTRMHSREMPKQFLSIHGKPIIIHTLEHFENNNEIDGVIIACVADWITYLQTLLKKFHIKKVKKIVPGGETGQLSIYNGLLAAKEVAAGQKAIVLIHDGVRPLINSKLLSDNIECVIKHNSAITTGVVKETIIVLSDSGYIEQVPSRDHSRVAKAPQSFWLDDILSVHEKAISDHLYDSIDSCTLMQKYGFQLYMVDGPYENIKITTPDDYYTMRAILDAKEDIQVYGFGERGDNGL